MRLRLAASIQRLFMTLVPNQADPVRRTRAFRALLRVHTHTFIVCGTLLSLTAIAVVGLHWANQQSAMEQFERRAMEALHLVHQRFAIYEQLLHSGAAFVGSSTHVTKTEWKRFTDYELGKNKYPGVLTYGYAP